jgi:hypothetical protein
MFRANLTVIFFSRICLSCSYPDINSEAGRWPGRPQNTVLSTIFFPFFQQVIKNFYSYRTVKCICPPQRFLLQTRRVPELCCSRYSPASYPYTFSSKKINRIHFIESYLTFNKYLCWPPLIISESILIPDPQGNLVPYFFYADMTYANGYDIGFQDFFFSRRF